MSNGFLPDLEMPMYALNLVRNCLTIRPEGTTTCALWLDGIRIGRFWSANDAAQLVARRQTGHVEIDAAEAELPLDVEGWRWISVRRSY
jgi:hypothetical protein